MNYSISLFNSNEKKTKFAEEVKKMSFEDLGQIILHRSWSPSIFKKDEKGGMHRTNSNFSSADFLVLDVDGGCSLFEASACFSEYQVLIATTRNHQKEKKKAEGAISPACDRFRVLIPFSKTISNEAEYRATWFRAKQLWPFIDDACKDPARFYFACTQIVELHMGKSFDVMKGVPNPLQPTNLSRSSSSLRGKLSRASLNFIVCGAPQGEWHASLFKATIDLKENYFPIEEAISILSKAATNAERSLDTHHDLPLIYDVYKNRQTKYPARVTSPTLRTYERMSPIEKVSSYEAAQRTIQQAAESSTTFVHPVFNRYYKLTMGLTLIGACSGCGKSTTAANLVFQFLKDHPDKEVLYISNEEDSATVLSRIACLELGVNFSKYRTRTLKDEETYVLVENKARELSQRVEIVEKENFDMTCLEDVIAVLETGAKDHAKIGLIVVDYLQTVFKSNSHTELKAFEVSKKLGHYLKEYGKRVSIPVVVFAQLKPRSDSPDMSSRFCNDKTMYHHAATVIEIKPDFEQKRTEFIIHKIRIGDSQGKSVFLGFNKGRFELAPIIPIKEERPD